MVYFENRFDITSKRKLDEKLLHEIDMMVQRGYVKTKKEAFEKALQLLIKSHKALELAERIDKIREGTQAMQGLTEAVIESHEEEGWDTHHRLFRSGQVVQERRAV